MTTIIYVELQKIFRKWRTYIGFIAIGVLAPIVQIALYYEGSGYVNHVTRGLQDSFFMSGNLFNGYLIGYIILQALYIHIPFLIVLVGGDLLAGEATSGTYRMLLTRPVSRFTLVTGKFIAGAFYVFLLLAFLFLVSVVGSLLIFGSGELITIKGKLIIFASDDVLWRFLAAYSYAFLSMTTVFAVSFFFSSMVENAIGPIMGTMAVLILLLILSVIPIDALQGAKKFYFTSYMGGWDNFFTDPLEFWNILRDAGVLLLHIFGLYGLTTYIFIKKDILS
ncbi:MAG: ABC transporter permease [Melioribacteraceae bacterium]